MIVSAGFWFQVPSHFMAKGPVYGWLFGAGPNNLNYNRSIEELSGGNEDPFSEKVAIDLESFVKNELKVNSQTKNKILKMIDVFGPGYVFGRKDIASLTGESVTAAGMIIAKLKNAGIIEPVSGQGKGKYRFRSTVMKSQA